MVVGNLLFGLAFPTYFKASVVLYEHVEYCGIPQPFPHLTFPFVGASSRHMHDNVGRSILWTVAPKSLPSGHESLTKSFMCTFPVTPDVSYHPNNDRRDKDIRHVPLPFLFLMTRVSGHVLDITYS